MCTAITYRNNDHYFGRNLDLEYSYNETVTITPRDFPLSFRFADDLTSHYAMIGMATVIDGYPLYYEATNECGLSMAGLNFPGNAKYRPAQAGSYNIGSFEFIPWLLGQCQSIADAKKLLSHTNIADISFSDRLPHSPLHWIISDATGSIVAEPMADGLRIYDNPIGILTNNPPFDFHMHYLCNFLNLTPQEPEPIFCKKLSLMPYSRAMGGIGLPGDASSASRFVRAAFHKLNAVTDGTEAANVSQFFHILDSVAMLNGSVLLGDKLDKTVYSCCCNTNTKTYYYTTYENRQITGIRLTDALASGNKLQVYPLRKSENILFENI